MVMICVSGILSQYSPGVMNNTIHQQQILGRLPFPTPQVEGYLAVENCSRIGENVWIDQLKFLITDCSGSLQTSQWMWNNNILGEVDYETALRWGTIGRGIKKEVCHKQMQYKRMKWEKSQLGTTII